MTCEYHNIDSLEAARCLTAVNFEEGKLRRKKQLDIRLKLRRKKQLEIRFKLRRNMAAWS